MSGKKQVKENRNEEIEKNYPKNLKKLKMQ